MVNIFFSCSYDKNGFLVIKRRRFGLFKAKTTSFYGCNFFKNSAYQNDVVLHCTGSKQCVLVSDTPKRRRFILHF